MNDTRITFRPSKEDQEILSAIREQLTESIGEPSDTDCIRFALRAANREIAGLPKPRHPRKHAS